MSSAWVGGRWKRHCFTETWADIFKSLHLVSDTCIPILAVALPANSLPEFPPVEGKKKPPFPAVYSASLSG